MNWGDLFTFDPNSGRIYWKANRPGRGCIKGREAGTNAHHSYRAVMVNGKKYYVHRIVWEMNNGPIPCGRCIDHIDGDRSNNRLSNLRLASLSENQRNASLRRNNRLGITGVYSLKGGYTVQCGDSYVGYYRDFFEACCARKSAEINNGFHENHGRKAR